MILFLWILGMLLSCAMTAILFQKINLAKMLICGSSIYFCTYTVVSGLLMWVNHFSIIRTQLAAAIIFVAVSAAFIFLGGRNIPKIKLKIKEFIPLAIVLIACAFLSSKETAGYYNTDQDQGLYQIRAMYYMGGNFDNNIDFKEYYELVNPYERELFKTQLSTMRGFYRLSDVDQVSPSSVAGVTHGIPTFPALLALWGTMFGLSNMNGMLTLLLLLMVANTYLISGNLGHKVITRTIASALVGICPIVMWSSKNVLTEIAVGMFLSCFYQLITESSKKKLGILAALPIVAAAFLHVTTTVFMPVVVVSFGAAYIITRRRDYVLGMVCALIGYVSGVTMMFSRFTKYTVFNYQVLFSKTNGLLTEDNFLYIVWILMILLSIVVIFIAYTPIGTKIHLSCKKVRTTKKGCKIGSIVFLSITLMVVAFFLYKGIKAYRQGCMISRLSIMGILMATGYIILPAAIIWMILLRKKIIRDKNKLILACSVLYCAFFYCGIMWVLVYYYYYYARYFTPFIFIFVLAGACLLDYFSWRIVVPVAIVCMAILIKQSVMLYKYQDSTYCSYGNIEGMASCIGEKDLVIILDQDLLFSSVFALPLDALTGADVLYARADSLDAIIAAHAGNYDNIYVALYDTGIINDESGKYRYVYKTKMETSCYERFITTVIPYPSEAVRFESPIAIMLYSPGY